MKILRTLLLLAATSVLAAGRDVTPLAYSTPSLGARSLGVAANGDSFVAIWSAAYELFATAIDRSGHVLTSRGVPITNDFMGDPQVLAFGNDFIITWRTPNGIQNAVEVNASLDVMRRFTLPATGRVATNGSSFAIANLDDNTVTLAATNGTRYAQRSLGHAHAFNIDVVAAGNDFVAVTWSPDVEASRVTADGQLLWHRTLFKAAAPQDVQYASAVSIDGDVAIAYAVRNYTLHSDDHLIWTLLDNQGGTTYESAVTLGGINNAVSGVRMIRNGNDYLLFASTQNKDQGYAGENIAHRITRGGGMAAVPAQTIFGALPSIASNGDVLYAVRGETVPAPQGGSYVPQVFGGILSITPDAWLRDVLSITPRTQAVPTLTSDGVGFFGAWTDLASDEQHRSIAALGQNGVAASTDDMPSANPFASRIALASNGRVNLAVWSEKDLQAKRYLPNGVAIDSTPIRIGPSFSPAYVASDGTRFLVIWSELPTSSLRGAWIGEDGSVQPIAAPFATDTAPYFPFAAGVAWNGREFLVVWSRGYFQNSICDFCFPPPPDVYATRVARDGSRTGDPVLIESQGGTPHVASDGRDFLVVTDEKPIGVTWRTSSVTTRYVRANANGLVVEQPSTLLTWPLGLTSEVAFNGTEFVVAARYGFDRRSYLSTIHVATDNTVRGRFLSAVQPANDSGESPAIASNASGDVLLAISEARDGWGVSRVRSYKETELAPAPSRPSPPAAVSATVIANTATVKWAPANGEVDGYVIETVTPNGPWIVTTVPGTVTTATIYAGLGTQIQIRAFGAGGTSEPSASVAAIPPVRRRAIQ
jgi:hypothetical protein